MQIIVDQSKILFNIENCKRLMSGFNIETTVLVKDFYRELFEGLNTDCIIWGSGERELNYNITKKSGVGGICTLNGNYPSNYLKYYPINISDNREGFGLAEILMVNADRAMVTNGCLEDDFSYESFIYSLSILQLHDCYHISVGGSYFIEKIINNSNLAKLISEIRIGEYAIFGTIPFSKSDSFNGVNAIKVSAKVIEEYYGRDEVLIDVGSAHVNSEQCKYNFSYRSLRSSTEYTIIKGSNLKKDDIVYLIPDYHSLPKLLRWKEHLDLN